MTAISNGVVASALFVLLFLCGSVGLRVSSPEVPDWVLIFDIGSLLSLAGLSLAWERAHARQHPSSSPP
jgi:hypothetical protein